MSALGLLLSDLDSAFEVWPDNMDAVNTFTAMSTQWRTGMAGATGLDYSALPPVLELTGIERAAWPDTFEGVRVMEIEALKMMSESHV